MQFQRERACNFRVCDFRGSSVAIQYVLSRLTENANCGIILLGSLSAPHTSAAQVTI